jgi:dTDP-4-amino-4,6-dideoxygalactose transaminase
MTRISLSPPDVGPLERESLLRALDEGWVAPAGPDLTAFEAEISSLTGWPGAVALVSGTAALHMALVAVDVQPGDDVFVSTFTFAATVNAIRYCGANPVFIDSETSSWNMSPALVAEELHRAADHNRLPKAIVVVDLYGQCADYDPIVAECHGLGIAVVEDAAEAIGATYHGRPAGTLADIGLFSFNGNKIITTSGGGMVISPFTAVTDRVRYLATQARQPTPHFEHTEVGYNYRLSNLLAALGRAQLARLPAFIHRRRAINDRYREMLSEVSGCSFMPIPPWSGWNAWLTCIVFEEDGIAMRVRETLASVDIESRPLWKPMHLQPAFTSYGARVNGTSEYLFDHGLCLPSGSALSDDQIDEVATVVRSTANVMVRR